MHKINWLTQLTHQLGLALIGSFVLLPVWLMLRTALDGAIESVPTALQLLPVEPTLSVFETVWKTPAQSLSFIGLLKNSLIVSGGAALLSVAFGSTMAYAFARFRFSGRSTGLFTLLVGALLPPVALMTPLYILLSVVGIRTSLFGLMVVYTSFSMPFCVWNMRSAFQAVSRELEEAAFLDGCTPLGSFWRISLPLALPSIAVAALLAFLMGYTEFAIGWLFVENSQNVTLAMSVSGMMRQSGAEWNQLSAISILMSLPVVFLFLGLYRFLVDGLLTGKIEV